MAVVTLEPGLPGEVGTDILKNDLGGLRLRVGRLAFLRREEFLDADLGGGLLKIEVGPLVGLGDLPVLGRAIGGRAEVEEG